MSDNLLKIDWNIEQGGYKMMKKECKYAIFDMDGTILDSMPYWENLLKDYIYSQGYEVLDNINELVKAMTVKEGILYIKDLYKIDKPIEMIEKEALKIIRDKYKCEIPVKEIIKERINNMYLNKVKMCILTSSDYECAYSAMRRVKLSDCFEKIYTSDNLGMSKRSGDIYKEVCKQRGYVPENTVVYEDALHGVKSAKEAGCYVVAVYDASSADNWNEIKSLADEYIIA